MPRAVVLKSSSFRIASKDGEEPDTYSGRLAKYIPAETLSAFLLAQGYFTSAGRTQHLFEWIVFSVLLVATAGYSWWHTKKVADPPRTKWLFPLVSTAAFAVWVFSIGGPFAQPDISWYNESLGAFAAGLFTLLVPAIAK